MNITTIKNSSTYEVLVHYIEYGRDNIGDHEEMAQQSMVLIV